MTKVVTTAGATTAEAPKVSVPRRKRDKGKGILIEEPKPLKGKAQIEQDEAFARQLEAKLNANLNWNAIMEKVTRSKRLNDAVMKYQALKRKPLTEAQAKKNMIIYLKNMVGFNMNYFKGMTYGKIRTLFEKHFNYNQAFLEEVNKEVTLPEKEMEVEAHKREGEILKIREDLESLWKLVKERFEKTEPKNYSYDYLLKTLRISVSHIVGLDLSKLAIILNRLKKIHSKGLTQKMMQEQESAKSDEEESADYEHEKEELRMNVDMEDLHVYKIIRANENTSYHKSLSSMLRKLDRQDLVDLHRLVMKRFKDNTLEEKRYPLIKEMLEKMLDWKLEAEAKSIMVFELLKFIKSQVEE
uniref:Uncharacterized protein n=1 Tax=Tanacetum cinerariifolium TaxID=118510 RepID=A0A6L2NV93_TANCI|nr:hypothetical protein [Tanacetum cinerariifolium]